MSEHIARFLAVYRRAAGLPQDQDTSEMSVADAIATSKRSGLTAVKRLVTPEHADRPLGDVRLTHGHAVHRSTRRTRQNFAICFTFLMRLRTSRLREAVHHVAIDLATLEPVAGFDGFDGLRYEEVDYRPRMGRELIEKAHGRACDEVSARIAPLRQEEQQFVSGQRRMAATRVKAYFHQLEREVLDAERRLSRRIETTRTMIAQATTEELRRKREDRLARLTEELAEVRSDNDFTLLSYKRKMEAQLACEEDHHDLELSVSLASAVVLEYESVEDTFTLVGRHGHGTLVHARTPFAAPERPRCTVCGTGKATTMSVDAEGNLLCPGCARVCELCGSVTSERSGVARYSKVLSQPCSRCGL